MTKFDFDLGIIGGGAAGLTVTAGAAQLGAKTLLVEKDPQLGGDCLHFGCVPSKTLIHSAQVYQNMKRATHYGLPEITVPPVDFARVRDRIRSVISAIQRHDSVERFCKLGAKVEFGAPRFIDEHAISLNGRNYSAKSWVIATGSSPAPAPIPGLTTTPFLTNREIFYLDRLPASMAVFGAGPIAIEMAQVFNRLGTKVFVIQRSGQILSKEDKDMADLVMQVMAEEGVEFYLNARVLGAMYLINNIDHKTLTDRCRKSAWKSFLWSLPFLLYVLVNLLFMKGYALNPETGEIFLQSGKYLQNLFGNPATLALLLLGLLFVIYAVNITCLKGKNNGIWFGGIGTVLVGLAVFFLAGFNNTAFYPSSYDLQSSLTIYNASSSHYTLTAMTYVALSIPFVLAYIAYVWRQMDSKRLTIAELQSEDAEEMY